MLINSGLGEHVISVRRVKVTYSNFPDYLVVNIGAEKSERELRNTCHAVAEAQNELRGPERAKLSGATRILLNGQRYHDCHP